VLPQRLDLDPHRNQSGSETLILRYLRTKETFYFLCLYTIRSKQKEEIIIVVAGDVFLNFALLALAEVPGYALSYLGMTWFGRKVPSASNWKFTTYHQCYRRSGMLIPDQNFSIPDPGSKRTKIPDHIKEFKYL
jgi:hypothetical protein